MPTPSDSIPKVCPECRLADPLIRYGCKRGHAWEVLDTPKNPAKPEIKYSVEDKKMSSGPEPEPDPFYVVWNPATGYTRHRHQNEESARKEAERLAREHPGTEFFVLSSVACCKVPPPVTPMWTQYRIDIPF